MKQLLLIAVLFSTSLSFGKELEISILHPDSVVADPALDSTSILHFTFPNANDMTSSHIQYSINGKSDAYPLISIQGDLELTASAGHHELQFYYSSDYYEEYTSVNIENGNQYYYSVYFTPAEMMQLTEKPVIYLYPEETTDIDVTVKPKGEFTFTYPPYNDGWKVTVSPDGKIQCDEESYNYLFWEAEDKLSPEDVDLNTGFAVAGEQITKFLEEKLTAIGLTSMERSDFITFWGPRMAGHTDVFLHFYFNEDCDRFGTLDIQPKPDQINRVYIVWQPIEQLRIAPTPQELPELNREGFNVLEWGGQELPTNAIRSL